MKKSQLILGGICTLSLILLYLPMLAVAVLSLNASKLGIQWTGLSLHWYAQLWENDIVLRALKNTLLVAAASTLLSTLLGTMLALALHRFPWPRWTRPLFNTTLYLPVVTPDIIFAATLVVAFRLLQALTNSFDFGLTTLILAHVTFQIAFVALIIQSRLATITTDIQEAARDLYADSRTLFLKVTLPLLWPGIIAAALLAFTLSLDDFIISFFNAGSTTTLPLYIYSSGIKVGLSPELHALSTLLFLATIALVFITQILLRPRVRDVVSARPSS